MKSGMAGARARAAWRGRGGRLFGGGWGWSAFEVGGVIAIAFQCERGRRELLGVGWTRAGGAGGGGGPHFHQVVLGVSAGGAAVGVDGHGGILVDAWAGAGMAPGLIVMRLPRSRKRCRLRGAGWRRIVFACKDKKRSRPGDARGAIRSSARARRAGWVRMNAAVKAGEAKQGESNG